MKHPWRNRVVRFGAMILFLSTVTAVGDGRGAGAGEKDNELVSGTGVGMYTDSSVANQVSSFTINPKTVSCGVGTLATGGDASGPFAMLMYATRMDTYTVDKEAREIRATGRMRSITKVGSAVVEDAEHDFLAMAAAPVPHADFNQAVHKGGARFDVHFSTPFWDRYNPMCTPSSIAAGACRFGGELLLGNVFLPQ